jgi:hypothetical protein
MGDSGLLPSLDRFLMGAIPTGLMRDSAYGGGRFLCSYEKQPA